MNEQYLGVGGRMVTVGGKAVKMPQGVGGRDGVTFTPSVSEDGNLSWTNDGGLANPQTVNLKGPKGDTGPAGADGKTPVKGTDYFTPTDVNEIAAEAANKVDISGKLDKTGDGSNVTAAFTAASTRANIATGEKLSVLFGKIAKWFSDLGSLAFKSTVAKSDLASDVQTSLGKADSALQNYTETDPTVPAWAKSKTKPTYTASEVGAVPTSRTVNGKALSANITLAASDVGALPSNTHIPSTVAEMSDAGNYALKSDKVSKSGDTMTGKLTVPQVETGDGNSNFFQCRKFRGEGDANTYYHAIDFGYRNHDQVDFHEYGGKWNFYKNQSGKVNEGSLCGKITTNGWEGDAKLTGSPTAPTPGTSDNSTRIATTAFVNSFNSTKLESNGDGSNVTAAFTAASSRTNISTGEKLSVIFGKIAKFFSDLKTVAFTGSYNDLSDKPTIPTAVTVDSAMSGTSTNPVQNKVIKTELDKKAASSHNQAASTITAGTFAGAVVAGASNQAPETSLLRNSKLVSSDTTPTNNGEIFWTYG